MSGACVPVVAPASRRLINDHPNDRSIDHPALQLAPRSASFVGRARELAGVVAAIDAGARRIWISGASGLGKTELLRQLAVHSRERGLPYYWLGPHEAATPSALGAIRDELSRAAGRRDARRLLVIDDFARLRPIEAWFVERFLPATSATITVVVADRSAAPAWRTAEQGFSLALAPLADLEARRYLELRGVAAHFHAEIVTLAEGIPALLAGAADAAGGRVPSSAPAFADDGAAFYARHDSDDHRFAIAVLVAARTTSRELLELAFGDGDAARDAFAWLSRLSVVDHTPDGLRPHTLLRRACERELVRHAGALWARARDAVRRFADDRIAMVREAMPPMPVPAPAATAPIPAATTPMAVVDPAPAGAAAPSAGDAGELSSALERRLAQVAKTAALSPREHEVLQLLLLGRNYTEIGTALRITPRTARFHQHNILEKIGAESRLDIVRLLL